MNADWTSAAHEKPLGWTFEQKPCRLSSDLVVQPQLSPQRLGAWVVRPVSRKVYGKSLVESALQPRYRGALQMQLLLTETAGDINFDLVQNQHLFLAARHAEGSLSRGLPRLCLFDTDSFGTQPWA